MQMAAALSYYTTFSLAPLLVLVIAIAGVVFEPEDVRGRVETEIENLVGQDGAEQVVMMIEAAEEPKNSTLATIISVGVLILGSVGLVGQLQTAVNRAWEVAPDPDQSFVRNFLINRLFSFGLVLGTGFLLLVSMLLSAAVTAMGDWIASFLPDEFSVALLVTLQTGLSLVVISVLLAAIFRLLPDAKVAWSDVAVGAVVTAVLFLVGKSLMGMYLGSKNMDSTFGAAGSLALLLMWIYYTSIIFLLGTEFTQAWAKNLGSGIRPASGAVKVVKQTVKKTE